MLMFHDSLVPRLRRTPSRVNGRSALLFGLLFTLPLGLLTGCQHTVKPSTPSTSNVVKTPTAVPTEFQLTGKIGVRTPQQSGSAFYAWAQQDQRFAIELSGALGIGQTRIEGGNGKFSLDNSNTGYLEADSAEALLQRATGWQAPISQLPRWVMGVAIAADSPATYDNQKRLATLTEQGWQVRFDYLDASQPQRPSRLIMTQLLIDPSGQSAGENRVTLTIQTRQER